MFIAFIVQILLRHWIIPPVGRHWCYIDITLMLLKQGQIVKLGFEVEC